MSSTNRSEARQEHIADYYITPVNKIIEFLNEFNYVENIFQKPNTLILDCCAGGDQKHDMSYPKAIKYLYPDSDIKTIDVREDSKAEIIENYLNYNLEFSPDIIITNPPFNIAMDIIQKSLNDVKTGGYVIMLLRLNFFGSIQRFEFFKNNLPKYCFVHHKRISFLEKGGSDSIEYCHMVWRKGDNVDFTKLKVI